MADADTTKTIRIIVDASRAVDGSSQATRALANIEKQTTDTAASLDRLMAGFETVTKLTVFGFGVEQVAGKLLDMWKSASEAASAIQELSEQLGVSTKFVQGSEFAAASNTVSIEKMSQGYTKASQIIGQAAQGQQAAVDLMNQLGVKILDAGGKLRSTESILSDSAAALLKVEDPAKRVALAIDLFGKSGAQLIPMLKDLAAGSDVMASKAADAGAMIEEGLIKQVADLKAHSEEAALKWNALILTIGTPIATTAMETVDRILGAILAKLKQMDAERASAEQGVLPQSDQAATLANYNRLKTLATDPANKNNAFIQNSFSKAELALTNMTKNSGDTNTVTDPNERASILAQQNAAQLLYSGSFPPTEPVTPAGVSNPGVKGAGQDVTDRIQKLKDTLKAAADAQDVMTAAARNGDEAFQAQQAHADALSKAIEAYGGKVSAADPKVQALAASLEQLILKTKEGASAQAFVVGTTELQKQNDLLTAQISLMNEAPDVQAREIALIKSQQEAQKAGNKLTSDDIENRRQAIEQNELLKTQQEQLKQAQELWTEPLKQALRDIQSAGASAFETMLDTGNFTFQSLAQTFAKIIKTMAAQFLALATIRPVMQIAVDAIGPNGIGLIGGNTAAQLGFPRRRRRCDLCRRCDVARRRLGHQRPRLYPETRQR